MISAKSPPLGDPSENRGTDGLGHQVQDELNAEDGARNLRLDPNILGALANDGGFHMVNTWLMMVNIWFMMMDNDGY